MRRSATICGAVLFGLACAPAPVRAEEARVTPAAIDEAIEQGVAWLLDEQKPQGTWGTRSGALGHTSLAVFALLHSGVREDQGSPAAAQLRRALRFLDRNGPGREGKTDVDPGTYTTALLFLLLRERGRDEDRARMQRLADLLVRTQADNGQWWYFGRPGKTGRTGAKTGDNSNTQFAVLALAAARGEGLHVPDETLARARTWWETAGTRAGGFGYASGGSPASATTGSMTVAGIACIAALMAAMDEPAPDAETPNPTRMPDALVNALDWLERHYSVTKNEGPAKGQAGQRQRNAGRGWLHYYLWTLERAMVLFGTERVGENDWYRDGALQLLKTQHKDGSWRGEHPLYATSFALLFLTRAADPPRAFTPPVPVPKGPITGPERENPPDTPANADPTLPAGTVADWLRGPLEPGELARRCRAAGPATLHVLVGALQDPDKEVRRRAWEALTSLLEPDRIFRADRHPLPRGRLTSWLRKNADDLVLREGTYVEP